MTVSILVDSMIVIYLVTCGSVSDPSWLGIVTLDSSLVFGTMVSSCLLDVSVACECSSSVGVVTSCLVACGSVPNSCFLTVATLDSGLLDGEMVSFCLLGINMVCKSSLGSWLDSLCLVAFGDVLNSCLLGGITLASDFIYGQIIGSQ